MEIEKILQKTDSLQQKTCWVFDFMPMRVPPARGELFSLLEPQLLAGGERQRLAERLARVALRLVCYFDFEAIREASGIWQLFCHRRFSRRSGMPASAAAGSAFF